MNIKEFIHTFRIIRAARKLEEFLWGVYNEKWSFEEWKRMIVKRAHKIVKIDTDNPHWKIELAKRLLQNACVSISLLGRIKELGFHDHIPSNLSDMEGVVRRCELKP